jgi:hypothetical protein
MLMSISYIGFTTIVMVDPHYYSIILRVNLWNYEIRYSKLLETILPCFFGKNCNRIPTTLGI